ncbi:DUF1885 family protein [Bacillus sp. DNRA2]|uniref:DUF1885 family protein n=1 Tax=Bacillus sp. DNRA2 TaxID=2723053 RepID=UPI00145F58C8|nr:DUF1885 family protein [Bacillus sp. DNRA2]NMD71931.1 DUF1885 family protein [Bacillus sp. DNRA2]
MAQNAYIKLVPASTTQTITTEELKNYFNYYKEITAKTGDQLDWNYAYSAFPYDIKEHESSQGKWFYLSATQDRYYAILIGIDQEVVKQEDGTEREQTYIQVTLPEQATAGDKGKANEFCKFLSKKLQGELHLFNGRVMYHYPRK